MWASPRPGITVRPRRSWTLVPFPMNRRTPRAPPAYTIRPSRTASARTTENFASKVRMVPPRRTVSAGFGAAEAAAGVSMSAATAAAPVARSVGLMGGHRKLVLNSIQEMRASPAAAAHAGPPRWTSRRASGRFALDLGRVGEDRGGEVGEDRGRQRVAHAAGSRCCARPGSRARVVRVLRRVHGVQRRLDDQRRRRDAGQLAPAGQSGRSASACAAIGSSWPVWARTRSSSARNSSGRSVRRPRRPTAAASAPG